MNTNSFKLRSFAKINWYLRVLGKRSDGYHEIRSLLQTISLCDELTFATLKEGNISLSCSDSTIPADGSNLVYRAAELLKVEARIESGAAIDLRKLIPTQAGLGGGSSNAAVALIGLNRLWNCGFSARQLSQMGATIGADVPFFFTGGTALAEGLGTTIRPQPDLPKSYLIVVSPRVSISTKIAYEALNSPSLTTTRSTSILARSFTRSNLANCDLPELLNDFEDVIFEREPEISRVKKALLDSGARGALLAGSGSSVFGVYADEAARQFGLDLFKAEHGWRVFACDTVGRDEYVAALDSTLLRSAEMLSDTGA